MPEINLRTRLIVAFLAINLTSVLGIAVMLNWTTTAALKDDVGANLSSLAKSDALATGNLLARQLEALLSLSTNRVLRSRALTESNAYGGDQTEIAARLRALDQQWLAAPDTDRLIQNTLENTPASEMLIFQRLFPNFVEVILTDRYGGLIAATNRTTDYYQADEDWWQAAYNHGQGATYLGQPVFDESSATLAVEIAVPLYAVNSRQVVGVAKAIYRLKHVSDSLRISGSPQRDLQVYLLFENGHILANGDYITDFDPETLSHLRATAPESYTEISLFGEDGLASQARVSVITGEPFVDALGWQVVVFQDRKTALRPIAEQQRFLLVLSVVTMAGATLTALWFAQLLTRPIRHLTETIQQVQQGNNQARASVTSNDETGRLAQAFNDMTDQLSVSIETLEKEIVERRHTEEELAHYRNHLEQLVAQRTAELTVANEELQRLSRSKDEFVSNVSHELQTPITIFTLQHYLLRKNPGDLQKHLSVLERETTRLSRTIEDLLRLSRLDQQRTEVVLGPVDLNVVSENLVNDRALYAQRKELALTFSGQDDLPVIMADCGLLEQVLSILLTNAINYTPSGGQITVCTQTEQRDTECWAGLCVADTGLGILPEEQPRLFERFFQGSANHQLNVPGTGLGLAIAKEIIDLHHGRIEVESTGVPGEGTMFNVWLPVPLTDFFGS